MRKLENRDMMDGNNVSITEVQRGNKVNGC